MIIIYIHIPIHINIYIYIDRHIYIYRYICIYMYIYICSYIYILYIYIYIIHIYIYIILCIHIYIYILYMFLFKAFQHHLPGFQATFIGATLWFAKTLRLMRQENLFQAASEEDITCSGRLEISIGFNAKQKVYIYNIYIYIYIYHCHPLSTVNHFCLSSCIHDSYYVYGTLVCFGLYVSDLFSSTWILYSAWRTPMPSARPKINSGPCEGAVIR